MTEATSAKIVLIAATELEARALRRELPGGAIVKTGVALGDLRAPLGDTVLSCGLAGGLRADLPTGTLLLPREVRRPDGRTLHCDAELVEALADAARALGLEPVFAPLLTAERIVHGAARTRWAGEGYAAVDMETGRLDARRVAAVRVVLDTPAHELSRDWERPLAAMLKPWNWPEAMWLAREAPRAARLAARVAAQGIAQFRVTRANGD
jgi:hypothetical protein